ncbi:hypothetical protein [Streptococcus orisratti]|uniref:hypothetical protein n=1 Tax=Streptococcus orisratti TaxID=114652 RepID=UPI003D055D9C
MKAKKWIDTFEKEHDRKPTPEEFYAFSKSKHHKRWLVSLICIGAVIAIGGGILYFRKNNTNSTTRKTQALSTNTSKSEDSEKSDAQDTLDKAQVAYDEAADTLSTAKQNLDNANTALSVSESNLAPSLNTGDIANGDYSTLSYGTWVNNNGDVASFDREGKITKSSTDLSKLTIKRNKFESTGVLFLGYQGNPIGMAMVYIIEAGSSYNGSTSDTSKDRVIISGGDATSLSDPYVYYRQDDGSEEAYSEAQSSQAKAQQVYDQANSDFEVAKSTLEEATKNVEKVSK